MALFTLDPGLVIWTWIAFAVLFFVLWKFVLPPLLASIREREEKIAGSVDNAEEIQKRLEGIKKEQEEILKEARGQADKVLRETRKKSEVLRQELLKKAEKEAEEIVSLARIRAAEEREALLQSLQAELADFVCDASEKIIGSSFTAKKDHLFARELAEKL